MKKISRLAPLTIILFPLSAFAQTTTNNLRDVITLIAGYLNDVLALLMGVAVVAFVYHVIKYFILKPDAERKEAGQYVMWSLIGFFVVLSFWGLVNILMYTFNFGQNSPASWSGFIDIFPH